VTRNVTVADRSEDFLAIALRDLGEIRVHGLKQVARFIVVDDGIRSSSVGAMFF
jgi:hypothetical protein